MRGCSERAAGGRSATCAERSSHVAFWQSLRRQEPRRGGCPHRWAAAAGGNGLPAAGGAGAREPGRGQRAASSFPSGLSPPSGSRGKETLSPETEARPSQLPSCGHLRCLSPCCQARLFILVLTFTFQLVISENAQECLVTL